MVDHRLTELSLGEGFDGRDGVRLRDFTPQTKIPPIIVRRDGEQKGDNEKDEEGKRKPEKVFAFSSHRRGCEQ